MRQATRRTKNNTDPDAVPAFLLIPQARRNATWAANPPTAMPAFQMKRGPDVDPEVLARIEAEKQAKSIGKLQRWKREAGVAKVDLRTMIWNPRRCRFEPDRFAHITCVPGKGMRDTKYVPPKDDEPINDYLNMMARGSTMKAELDKEQRKAQAIDDLGANVSLHCGADTAKLKAFAVANGVWDDKYEKLPNPGLRRMNVVNRLRAKVRKGHKVVW